MTKLRASAPEQLLVISEIETQSSLLLATESHPSARYTLPRHVKALPLYRRHLITRLGRLWDESANWSPVRRNSTLLIGRQLTMVQGINLVGWTGAVRTSESALASGQ